jgi:hypothetical protein
MDHLPLDDVNLLYVPIDPGAQWHDVSVDLRVVRTFIKNRIPNDPHRWHSDQYYERRYEQLFVLKHNIAYPLGDGQPRRAL